jgi:broad specificity phosphatase PhoE
MSIFHARKSPRGSRRLLPGRVPLIFVRHGETDWNREFRFQGQRDIPMNERGRRQAARNGRAVAGILSAIEWKLVSSPLGRSVETMRILLEAAGQGGRAFDTDPALVEVRYGDWEGLTLTEISERFPSESRARDADKWGYVPANGESYALLSKRVLGWLEKIDAPTLVVAHGGVLRALFHLLAGLPAHDAPHLAVPQDQVILFTQTAVMTI